MNLWKQSKGIQTNTNSFQKVTNFETGVTKVYPPSFWKEKRFVN